MKTAIVTAKIDPKIKASAEKAARDLGVSLSFVISHKLKEFVEEKTIQLIPNAETIKILRKADKDRKLDKNIVGPFTTAEAFIKSLNE